MTAREAGRPKRRPFAFTVHGQVMRSSGLNSPRAIQASIEVMRAVVAGSEQGSVFEMLEKLSE